MPQFKMVRRSTIRCSVKPKPLIVQICDVPHMILATEDPGNIITRNVHLREEKFQRMGIAPADSHSVSECPDGCLGVIRHIGSVGVVPLIVFNMFCQITIQGLCLLPLRHGIVDQSFNSLSGQFFRLLQQGETLIHSHPHGWGISELCPVLTKRAKDIPAAYLL